MTALKHKPTRRARHDLRRAIQLASRCGGVDDAIFDHIERQAEIRDTTSSAYLRTIARMDMDRNRVAK